MNIPTQRWKEWEGRLVDEKFPLRRWLGSSDHSVVFLTDRDGASPQQTAIKLISAESLDTNIRLLQWAETAKLSHPQLIRLFTYGRCTIDDVPLLYVVMEYGEENLAEIIPLRSLSADEALEMLRPAAAALAFIHGSGLVHSRIQPSNIMAVGDHLKLSSDGLRRFGQGRDTTLLTAYDAPEVTASGFSPASDVWSLGATLASVLTQKEPTKNELKTSNTDQAQGAALLRVPEQLRRIVRLCMQEDPAKRPTAEGLLQELSERRIRNGPAVNAQVDPHTTPQNRRGRRILLPAIVLAAVLLTVLIAMRFMGHEHSVPAAGVPQNPQSDNLAEKSSTAPEPKTAAQEGLVSGSVLNRVMPEVSPSALHTIRGRIKVGVEVTVDSSGKILGTRLVSPGPSRYFSSRSLAAARQWKFSPAQQNGEPVSSEWVLRFQFARGSAQVFPSELKP